MYLNSNLQRNFIQFQQTNMKYFDASNGGTTTIYIQAQKSHRLYLNFHDNINNPRPQVLSDRDS